jgi:enoyl-[acyl-carrier protein] reductase I
MAPHYLITGVANEWSIAWAVAQRVLERGGVCHLACLPANERRVRKLMRAHDLEDHVYAIDVTHAAELESLAGALAARTDTLSGVLHAVAYADLEELQAGLLHSTREGFAKAMDVSVYSLVGLCRATRPLLREGSSVVALTYHGSQVCIPGYNVMGVAKAALESLARYLASELGPAGIRVNTVSPGPILTLAASVFDDIEAKIERAAQLSPLRQRTTQQHVAGLVDYLFSEAASAVTGQCLYVDHGLSSVAAG